MVLDGNGFNVFYPQFLQELVKTFNFHRFDNLITLSKRKIDPRLFKDEHNRQSVMCLLYSATTGDLTALKRYNTSAGIK